jgi:F-type H+-transporting ATPase subunit b
MRKLLATLSLAGAFALAAAPIAAAQEHEGEGEHEAAEGEHGGHAEVHLSDLTHNVEFWGSIVNFTLLLVVLVYLGKKPLSGYLSNRRKTVEEGLAEAARLKEQAEKKYAEYSSRLEKLDKELDTIRAEMIKAGEAERDRIVAEAEEKAARVRRETEFVIEQQMKQLKTDLTREAVAAAVTAASEVLREQTGAADQERLAQTYLERLKEQRA